MTGYSRGQVRGAADVAARVLSIVKRKDWVGVWAAQRLNLIVVKTVSINRRLAIFRRYHDVWAKNLECCMCYVFLTVPSRAVNQV